MQSRVRIDNARELSDLKREGGVFEGLLHLSASERSEITATLSAAAIAELGGQISELGFARHNLGSVAFKDGASLVLGASDFGGLSPRSRIARLVVLDEEVGSLNLLIHFALSRWFVFLDIAAFSLLRDLGCFSRY